MLTFLYLYITTSALVSIVSACIVSSANSLGHYSESSIKVSPGFGSFMLDLG